MNGENILNTAMIEKKYQINLSQDYKKFLSDKPNGFIAEDPNFIEFEVDFLDDSSIALDKIYGFNELIEINSEFLCEINDFLRCIIIGEDPGGNFFLIEDITGHIMYWDRTWLHNYVGKDFEKEVISYKNESEDNDEDDCTSIFLLFNSFKELEEKIINSIDLFRI